MMQPLPRRSRLRACLLAPLVAFLGSAAISACSTGESADTGIAAEWRAQRDTVGDTVVVRTLEGSVWGDTARLVEELRIGRLEGAPEETFGALRGLAVGNDGTIYVVDRQVPALRVYGPDGAYLRTIGSEGNGPGEYERPDGGIAVLPDGRIVLRDPANARINVYAPDGTFEESWRIRGGRFTSRPLYVDTAGYVHHMMFEIQDEGTEYWLLRFDGEGNRADSLHLNRYGWQVEGAILEARFEQGQNRSISRGFVPFSPRGVWTFSPLDYPVGGISDEYEIDLMRSGEPVLRLARSAEPVPVLPEEKANQRERTTAGMRNTDPDWSWNGPPIPDTKPSFRSLMADEDGRVWVRRHVEAEPIPEDQIEEPEDPNARPPVRWHEPHAVFDVFEPDGRYLGPVYAPDSFSTNPQPVIRGARVWAVARDHLDVEYVVRYRIEVGTADPE